MAGCDFSTREYSYDDVDGDFNLTNFALTLEDLNYKVSWIDSKIVELR
jgi:glucosylceramidase